MTTERSDATTPHRSLARISPHSTLPHSRTAQPQEVPLPDSARHLPADPIAIAHRFADDLCSRSPTLSTAAPVAELQQLGTLGLLTAPLPRAHGGLGLGTGPGQHLTLLRVLALIGGADLALGRLYEGHVNALILISTFGTPAQLDRAAADARAGLVFGVWNTGSSDLLRLDPDGPHFRYTGGKTFATGAAFVQRPILTAELTGAGWQMTMPRMESATVQPHIVLNRDSWHPLGMESSESFDITLTGALIEPEDLLGAPGDFYRDPLFRGGAIRFAAVQAGAILRLHHLFVDWLHSRKRTEDPYQIARLGEIALAAQEATLWIERAADLAESALCLSPGDPDKLAAERMVECANMTRLAIERIATPLMQRIISGVGAHGLLHPHPFERILRNLTMYLRQPAPDQTLADVGRASLRKSHLRSDGTESGLWSHADPGGSLPPSYFEDVYAASPDPWNFETSEYEARKYQDTLAHLPRERYTNALEIGCSIGVLTRQLAARCDTLLSVDVSERALATATTRCADLPHVHFAQMHIPNEIPDGAFDLVVISEVGYYWQREDLERTASLLAARQPPGGQLILVHYTPTVPDYPLTGDQVHETWLHRPEWSHLDRARGDQYRLDLLERRP